MNEHRSLKITAGLLALAFVAAPIAEAQDFRAEGVCLDTPGANPRTGVSLGTVNCTANDQTFVLLGLGVADDGCVSPDDTAQIYLRAIMRNTTAQTRYDLGLWVSNNGEPAQIGSSCTRSVVQPSGPEDLPAGCYPDNPNGAGPYLNTDGDACGDLAATSNELCTGDGIIDGMQPDTIFDFIEPVEIACQPVLTGFIGIPSCISYANQEDQVDDSLVRDSTQARDDDANADCDDVYDIVNGTPSKCGCLEVPSNVPAPDLFCSSDGQAGATEGMMSCTILSDNGNGLLDNGETTRCTVYYTNAAPTCTNPTPTPPENIQCGTVGHVQFEIDFDESRGTVSNFMPGDGGSGSVEASYANAADDVIRWRPESAGSNPDIINPQRSFSFTFDFYLDPNLNGTTTADLTFSMDTFWNWNAADGSGLFDDPRLQDIVSCTTSISTTPVTVASVGSRRTGGGVEVAWTTATETANVGFNVYVESADGWRKVNDELILSQGGDSFFPTDYRFALPRTEATQFLIEDVDASGGTRRHGPYEIGTHSGHRPELERIDWQAVRIEQQASPRGRSASRVTAAAKGGSKGADPGKGKQSFGVDLRVDENGLVRVGYDDLVAAGFDPSSIAADTLAVSNRGVGVPIEVVASGRTFGPGSYLELHGEALDAFYTTTNVYRLTSDRKAAQRIGVEGAAPGGGPATTWYLETLVVDDDLGYSVSAPGDPWYLRFLPAATAPRSTSFTLPATGLVAVPGVAPRVEVELGGGSDLPPDPDHHVRVLLNGVLLGEAYFDGLTTHVFSAEVPAGVLAASNTLVIQVAADLGLAFDTVFVDSVSLSYPRDLERDGAQFHFRAAGETLQVTGAGTSPVIYRLDDGGPVRLDGADLAGGVLRFRGTAGLADYLLVDEAGPRIAAEAAAARPPVDLSEGVADYLVVAPGAFAEALQPLLAQRASQGLAVRLVDVADVYDRYSHGIRDAAAIKAYVADAVQQMGVRYVLLAGDDTTDYRGAGDASSNLVPTLYAPTSDLVQWAPVDPLFGDVDGDEMPDVPVGRLPARSVEELELLVAKTLRYEARADRGSGLFSADASEPGGVSFRLESDLLVDALGGSWSIDRAYVDTLGFAAARQALLDGFDAGPALVSFVGHSGPSNWSFSGLLRASDVGGLQNLDQPSIVVQWGCWNTFHVLPSFNTLGHRFLLEGDQGAAAVLGASTLLETTSARRLSLPLMEALASGPVALGDALQSARESVHASAPASRDVLLGFALLGDPAMPVAP